MFFYIGDDCPIKSMRQVEPRLFVDEGWNQKNGIWYKGYSTECVLEDAIYDIVNGYKPSGKYCVICADEIYHPLLRGFPVFEFNNDKTNIKLDNFLPVEYDKDRLQYHSATDTLTLDQVSHQIGDILLENTENFYKYNEVTDITVIFSGGLDTATSWAIQEAYSPKFNLSIHVPDYLTETTIHEVLGTEREYNSELIDKVGLDYWGYLHACYYKQLNWSNTGYYAEVYTYRDGEAINAIANYYGKKIYDFAKEEDYLYWFLKRPATIEHYKNSDKKFETEDDLKSFLWYTIWYDHQMWHLDNNMMFCPFADIRIPLLMNKLSVEDLASSCVSGIIQRKIIKRFKPELLSILSDYKNEKNVWKNFRANFNESMVHPDTKLIYR